MNHIKSDPFWELLLWICSPVISAALPEKPLANVHVIIIVDLGFHDLSYNGSIIYETHQHKE